MRFTGSKRQSCEVDLPQYFRKGGAHYTQSLGLYINSQAWTRGASYTREITVIAEWGKSGSCSACPIAVFCQIHLQLATGPVVMLHTVYEIGLIKQNCLYM